jgi:hypothetical protein
MRTRRSRVLIADARRLVPYGDAFSCAQPGGCRVLRLCRRNRVAGGGADRGGGPDAQPIAGLRGDPGRGRRAVAWCTPLAAVELVGAAGLLVGLAIEPVGVAASAGVLLYFLGAMAAHVRAKDWFGLRVPGTVAVLAGVVLWLRIITL